MTSEPKVMIKFFDEVGNSEAYAFVGVMGERVLLSFAIESDGDFDLSMDSESAKHIARALIAAVEGSPKGG